MRRGLRAVLMAALCAGVCLAQAQDSQTAALEHGSLVVWVVRPGTRAEKLRITAEKNRAQVLATPILPTTVQQQTAGSFGQPSSNVGQTAGSTGQTAGSFGTNASDAGQTSSSYGTTAGSFGTAASDHGQTASSVGQTAGSFGQTSSTHGHSLDGTSLAPPSPLPSPPPVSAAASSHARDELAGSMHTFPQLGLRTVDVIAEELQDKLAAQGSADYPDVLLIDPAVGTYNGPWLTMLGWPSFFDTDDPSHSPQWRDLRPVILTHAPHLAQAQAFVVWLRDAGLCLWCGKALEKNVSAPASVAASALQTVLQGDSLGAAADAEAVHFSPRLAQSLALMAGVSNVPGDLKFRTDVMSGWANDRLAVFTVRGIASSPSAFGVVHALVTLRKDDGGRWKVLHISPNMPSASLHSGLGNLERVASLSTNPKNPLHIVGISQAAPPDGDNRPSRPDLWWDNAGDAKLLVVEWQFNDGREWADSRLMMVPDSENRTKTRVSAQFAAIRGEYRWRVWSVGAGGAMALSPWKRLNIMP